MKERLFNLCFFELDVFSNNRVIFCFCHLFRHCAAVLLCYIEEARIGGRQKLDFNRVSLGHIEIPAFYN